MKTKDNKIIFIKNSKEIICPYCDEDECAEIIYLSTGKKYIVSDCDPNSYDELNQILNIKKE